MFEVAAVFSFNAIVNNRCKLNRSTAINLITMEIPREILRSILVINYGRQKTLRLVCQQWQEIADGDDFLSDTGPLIFWELSSNILHKWWDRISTVSIRRAITCLSIDRKVLAEHYRRPIFVKKRKLIQTMQCFRIIDSIDDLHCLVSVSDGNQIIEFCKQHYDEMNGHWHVVAHVEQIAEHFPDRFNFSGMFLYKYSAAFLTKFKDRIDWNSARHPTIEQMKVFGDVINWSNVVTTDVPLLKKYKNKIDWEVLAARDYLPFEVLETFADELRPYLLGRGDFLPPHRKLNQSSAIKSSALAMDLPQELEIKILRETRQQLAVRGVCRRWQSIVDCPAFFADRSQVVAWELPSNMLTAMFRKIFGWSWDYIIANKKINAEVLREHRVLIAYSCTEDIYYHQEIPIDLITQYNPQICGSAYHSTEYRIAYCDKFVDDVDDECWESFENEERIVAKFPERFALGSLYHGDFSIEFCAAHKELINWAKVGLSGTHHETLEFYMRFENLINWQTVKYIRNDVLLVFGDRVDWYKICKRNSLSVEVMRKYSHCICWKEFIKWDIVSRDVLVEFAADIIADY